MTFSVVRIENGRQRVIGTIWAGEESEARAIASDLCRSDQSDSIVIRPTEENEMKLNLSAGIKL